MKRRAWFQLNAAVLLFGTAGLLAGMISMPGIGVSFGRVLVSSVCLFIWSRIRGISLDPGSGRDLLILAVSGAVLAFHWWSFIESVKTASVAVGTLTFSAYPLFVTVLEAVLEKRKPSAVKLVCSFIIIAAVVVDIPKSGAEGKLYGFIIGICSAGAYAVLTLLNKKAAVSHHGIVVSFWEQGFAALLLLPFAVTAGLRPTGRDVLLVLVLGAVSTALAHTLFTGSLKDISAAGAGIVSSLETVYGILFAFLILHEVPTGADIVSALMITAAAVLSSLSESDAAG